MKKDGIVVVVKTLTGQWGRFFIVTRNAQIIVPVNAQVLAMAQLN